MLPPPTKLEALVLDLFGVIVAFDDSLVYDRIAQRCALPAKASAAMTNLVSDPALIRGKTSLQQLHTHLQATLGLSASLHEFETLWLTSYSEPMPGMRDLLRQLGGQCRLVLLSNVDRYYWSTVLSAIPEIGCFHARVLSFEQGVAKPDAEAFARAIDATGAPVENCYFVDDKLENVEAAARVGLAGHVFKTCRELKASLRQAGMRVE